MSLMELLVALISIMFVFDSAIIRILNISFIVLLIVYISSVVEISVFSVAYEKIKYNVRGD